MSEKITGYIDHVVFRNNDNGYTVMVVKGTKEEELTCVGSFPSISQGVTIEAEGTYTTHPVYGKQFQIHSYTEKMPEDSLAMERYLGSGAIKGIGAALAARIVRHFGEDTLRIVEEEPERLSEVKGISEKKARELTFSYADRMDVFVCASDLMAIGAMRALMELDVFHPVCGFDGIPLMSYAGKQMNTVRQDFYGVSAAAVEEVDRLLHLEEGRNVVLGYELVRMRYQDIVE